MVFLCFLIPILFTQKNKVKEIRTDNNIVEKEETTPYDYGQYKNRNITNMLQKLKILTY
jgi:hypothetical protein